MAGVNVHCRWGTRTGQCISTLENPLEPRRVVCPRHQPAQTLREIRKAAPGARGMAADQYAGAVRRDLGADGLERGRAVGLWLDAAAGAARRGAVPRAL